MNEWTEEEWQQLVRNNETAALYFYTPLCGTCQLASKMLHVVKEIPNMIQVGQINANYAKTLTVEYEIESVPCLLIMKNGKIEKKIYAFQSVPYLVEQLHVS